MMIFFRNIYAITLALLVAVSSVGFSVSEVYCFHKQQNEYSFSVIGTTADKKNCSCKKHKVTEKSSCCKSKEKTIKKKCCTSHSIQFILDSEFEQQQQQNFFSQSQVVWVDSSLPVLSLNNYSDLVEYEDYNLRPPPLATENIPILFQSFLI